MRWGQEALDQVEAFVGSGLETEAGRPLRQGEGGGGEVGRVRLMSSDPERRFARPVTNAPTSVSQYSVNVAHKALYTLAVGMGDCRYRALAAADEITNMAGVELTGDLESQRREILKIACQYGQPRDMRPLSANM